MPNIKLLSGKNVNEQKWNDCVAQDDFPLIYGNVWYLDLVSPNWDALVYGDYEAVLPLPSKKKTGINYLYRPYGVQQLGVFGNHDKTEELLKAIPKKYLWIDLFLNAQNLASGLAKHLTPQQNLVLDLNRSYQEVFEGYSKRTKRNLKKAKKAVFNDHGYVTPEMLIDLFKQNKGKSLNNLKDKHYAKMLQLMHTLTYKKLGYIVSLYTEPNQLCAAMFLMEWKGRITFLFSATNETGKELQAMTKMLDELFIIKSEKSVLFDFEGTNIINLAEFYKGFGAQRETYYNYFRNYLPLPRKIIQKLI